MPLDRAAYYARRAKQERKMAEASKGVARHSHLMLAEQYERIAAGILRD